MKMIKNEHLKLFFIVLLFGGLWGILEATLGTVLHLTGTAKTFLSSSIVMVPLAYFIMGGAYKLTGKLRTVFYIGFVAACIKLFAFFVPGIAVNVVVNPALSMIMEAAAFGLAIYVIKPTNVLSIKSIVVVLFANLTFRVAFTLWQLATIKVLGSASFTIADGVIKFNESGFVKFNITQNYLSSLYAVVIGLAAFGIAKAFAKHPVKLEGLKKVIYNPITASLVACTAIALTIVL